MKKSKLKGIFEYLIYLWYTWYSVIMAALITGFIVFEQNKHDLNFWRAEYYSDMLTAIITFLSIIIGIFGILIPSVISAKEDKESITNYFFQNADRRFFSKCIRKIISSGILAVICICLLYLQDILSEKIYIWIFRISVFLILYFCFGSYRFIGIMLRLLVGEKDKKETRNGVKKYKNKTNETERKIINEKLINRNNSVIRKRTDDFDK